MEPGPQPGADESGEADEHEEGDADEPDLSAAEAHEDAAPSGSRASSQAAGHPAAPAGSAPEPSPEDAHRESDRGPFSFFSSWIRREPPPTPGTGRGGSSDSEG